MNYKKKFFTGALAVVLISTILWPNISLAQTSNNPGTDTRERPGESQQDQGNDRQNPEDRTNQARQQAIDQICTRIENFQTTLLHRLEQQSARLQGRVSGTPEEVATLHRERQSRLEERRNERSSNFEEHFRALEDRAETPERQATTREFRRKVLAVIGTRREAVDRAIDEFRTGMDVLIQRRRQEAIAAATTMRDAMRQALADMAAECRNSDNPQDVMSSLRQRLGQARTGFAQDRSEINRISEEAKALAEARNQAIRTANEAFRTAIQSAVEELKTALQQSTDTEAGIDTNTDTEE